VRERLIPDYTANFENLATGDPSTPMTTRGASTSEP
jgi:hypothetical protein